MFICYRNWRVWCHFRSPLLEKLTAFAIVCHFLLSCWGHRSIHFKIVAVPGKSWVHHLTVGSQSNNSCPLPKRKLDMPFCRYLYKTLELLEVTVYLYRKAMTGAGGWFRSIKAFTWSQKVQCSWRSFLLEIRYYSINP